MDVSGIGSSLSSEGGSGWAGENVWGEGDVIRHAPYDPQWCIERDPGAPQVPHITGVGKRSAFRSTVHHHDHLGRRNLT